MRESVAALAGHRVAVIGDVMLDHFLVGRVDRISPEAPVPVVRFERDEHRLGGAANVAHNVRALGGRVTLVGLVGDDEAAAVMRHALAERGLDAGDLLGVAGRPTTRKVRIVTSRNQQVARIDYESDDVLPEADRARLTAAVRRAVADANAVVLSDYRKGVISPEIIAAAIDAARPRGVPVLVDPKVPVPERYRHTTVITPNHHEAEVMTQSSIRSPDDARAAARTLHARTGASVVVTWGEHGLWVLDASGPSPLEAHLPASAREVADVTGAGDTVIAVLGLGLAAGLAIGEAARLANAAAGLVVARFGPATVSPDELDAALAS
ncbi:MAG TPA: D-glycero-beta-D-manno-heptose-7-phosphate kinase [Vicinamibacterales bacterium]|nr:D-glycero-beta-D-manno-heptose-7-phosphate kinase [Vicinamibacterales bacterium]